MGFSSYLKVPVGLSSATMSTDVYKSKMCSFYVLRPANGRDGFGRERDEDEDEDEDERMVKDLKGGVKYIPIHTNNGLPRQARGAKGGGSVAIPSVICAGMRGGQGLRLTNHQAAKC